MVDMEELNTLSERAIGFAIQVHCELGPGLLESTYRGEAATQYFGAPG